MNKNVTDGFEGGECPLKPSLAVTIFAFGLKQRDCVFCLGNSDLFECSEFQREDAWVAAVILDFCLFQKLTDSTESTHSIHDLMKGWSIADLNTFGC